MALVDSFDGIIFDYGGVLVHHQTAEDHARMAAIAGLPTEQFTALYWRERLDYDKGVLSGPEYWQRVVSRNGNTVGSKLIEDLTEYDSTSWMNYDDAMWEWIGKLRAAGKRLAMLSNMPRDLGEALKFRTNKLAVFDHVTLSYEVHGVKPEPAIYHDCLDGVGTQPNRTLFFDDRIENVQGAEAVGIRAIQFTSRDEVFLKIGV